MESLIRSTVLTIGQHRGAPRIYIEGRYLIEAGFEPGRCYVMDRSEQGISLSLCDEGRTVSGKRLNTVGVIDLNSQDLEAIFGQAQRVMVQCRQGTISIQLDRIESRRRERVLDSRSVAMFAGGGLLSQAARQAGFKPVAAIEIDSRYADIYQANHGGHMICTSVEQVPWEQLASLAPIGLLEMGIPCEPYSRIRRLDRGSQYKRDACLPPESHELGDMVYWALKAVDIFNPHTVVIEEVPPFLNSGASYILQYALRRMGYTVEGRVLNPRNFGSLTGRRRAVVVATTFDDIAWPEPSEDQHFSRLGDLFDDIPDDSDAWFDRETKPWLYKHWARQNERGNGFEPPKLTAESTACPTIKKRYFAGQGDNPVVQHPVDPNRHRWLTLDEVRRLMGMPDGYELGTAKTVAGEVLGQGVEVGTFTRLIRSVTRKEAAHVA
jgi:DNA (cytosine-5)-methyltransferase 1